MDTQTLKKIIRENEGKNPLFILCEMLKRKSHHSMSIFIQDGLLERFTLDYFGKKCNSRDYIYGSKENKAWHEFIKKELEFITQNLKENSDVISEIPAPFQFNNLIEIEHNGEFLKVSAIRENGDLVTDFHENERSIYNVLHLNTKQLNRLNDGYSNDGDNELPKEIIEQLSEIYDSDREGSYEFLKEQVDFLNSIGYTADYYVSGDLFGFAKLDILLEGNRV